MRRLNDTSRAALGTLGASSYPEGQYWGGKGMEGSGDPNIAPGQTPLYFIGRFSAAVPIRHGSLSAIQAPLATYNPSLPTQRLLTLR